MENLRDAGGKKPKKRRPGAAETALRLGDAMDLPPQMLPGFSHVELWQNRQAVIEGVKGVLSYSESEIQLNMGALVVTFKGADLGIKTYQAEILTMAGVIAEVHFSN